MHPTPFNPTALTLIEDRLYTAQEVASLFRLNIATIYKWQRAGIFPASVPIGPRAVRWRGTDLLRHIEQQRGRSAATAA